MKYKYTLTIRGFETIQKEASHPFKGWQGGLKTIMKKAQYIQVKRGNKTVKRIELIMFDGCVLYSLEDWRQWNKNPHLKLIEQLHK
tara:strand:- start:99 stop:356 length:258 start_codon:yes stop_codon:yes gene_type:complete